jgi:hypothetical protein
MPRRETNRKSASSLRGNADGALGSGGRRLPEAAREGKERAGLDFAIPEHREGAGPPTRRATQYFQEEHP